MRSLFTLAPGAHRVLEDEAALGHRTRSKFRRCRERIGVVVVVIEREVAASCKHGLWRVHAHRPQHDVEMVHAPRHLMPGACNAEPIVPVVVIHVRVVGAIGRRTDVKVPVQFRWRRAVARRTCARKAILVIPDPHFRDLAQFPGLDQFHSLLVVLLAALLRAHLHNAAVLARRLDRKRTLANRVAQRFFKVNVFARLAGCDHLRDMPLLVAGDDNRVDVLVLEQLAEVPVCRNALPAGTFPSIGQVLRVHVANRDKPCAGQFLEARNQQGPAPGTAADQPQVDGVVRAG